MGAAVADTLRRARAAFGRLDQVRGLYRPAYALGCPHREGWSGQAAGEQKHARVYDSTYADSVERLANVLFSGMVPPWLQWFEVTTGSEIPEEHREPMQQALQSYQRALKGALDASNFYAQVHPVLLDLCFGTGALLTEPDERKAVRYTAVPVHELGLECGAYGDVDGIFRRQRALARHLPQLLPKGRFPDALARQIKERPDDEVELLTATHPDERRGRWLHQVLDEKAKAVLEEWEFASNPWAVPRWMVLAGETYGRGPALKAAPTAQTLNEAIKLLFKASTFAILGMYTVRDDGVINPGTTKLVAGGMIPVDSNDHANPSIKPLVPGTQFDVAQFQIEDLRSMIKRDLFVDQLGNVEGPRMTATEVMERQAMIAQDKGAAFGRMTGELLTPCVQRTAELLAQQGRLPAVKLDGRTVQLKFVSPLAKAQGLSEAQAIDLVLDFVGRAAAVDPAARAYLKTGELIRTVAEQRGAPLKAIRSDEEAEAILQQIATAQAQAAQAGADLSGALAA